MAKPERVVLADEAADHPSPLGTTAIALLALSAGFACAYVLRAGDAVEGGDGVPAASRVQTELLPATGVPALNEAQPIARAEPIAEPETEPAAEPDPEREAVAAIDPEPVAEPDPQPVAEPVAERDPQPVAQPALAVAPVPTHPARAAAPRSAEDPTAVEEQRLKPGIVAYLRCDGVPQRAGPYPCPRDVPLERRVWQSLRWLEHCPALAGARGPGEVRLEFTREGTQVHVVSGELDRKAVRQCAAGLSSERTALRPTKMIVAFRFGLR